MKFFIICRYSNIPLYYRLKQALEAKGDVITRDWYAENPTKDQLKQDMTAYEKMLDLDIQGIKDADVVYAILPGGSDFHVELGAALALNKPVILLNRNPEDDAAYYEHAYITSYEYDAIFDFLRERAELEEKWGMGVDP